VDGDDVGAAADVVDVGHFDAEFFGGGGGDEGVVAEDAHAEGAHALGDFAADLAQAEDAEGLAEEFLAGDGFLVPFAVLHGAVG
jgi:hypothetical protein